MTRNRRFAFLQRVDIGVAQDWLATFGVRPADGCRRFADSALLVVMGEWRLVTYSVPSARIWGYSSVGRALPWHGRGQEFDSP